MQTQKIDVKQQVKKVQEGVVGSAHSVWLAGLGAVALAGEQGRGVFDDLVGRGRKVEARGKQKVDRAKGEVERAGERVKGRVEELGEVLDRRVAEVMHRMNVPTREEIAGLTRRIEELTARVGEMATAERAAAKPVAVPRPAAKKAAKPAAAV